MAIDWTSSPRVVALVQIDYVGADDSAATLRVSGPTSLVGSGIVAQPGTSQGYAWEGRLRSMRVSDSMQELPNAAQRLGSLGLRIAATFGEALSAEVISGTWTGAVVQAWLYDLDTGDYEPAWLGRVDTEPTWEVGSMSLSAVWDLGSLRSPVVCTVLPSDASGWTQTSDYSGGASQTWNPPSAANIQGPIYPNVYGLHTEIAGCVLAPVWGHGADGWTFERTGGNPPDPLPGTWVEVAVYGQKTRAGIPATGPYYWAHVCQQVGVFVWDVLIDTAYRTATETEQPILASDIGAEVVTGYNSDPTAGPVGTFVRIGPGYYTDGGLDIPLWTIGWRDEQNRPRAKVWALVTGLGSADTGGSNYDADDNPFLNSPVSDGGAGTYPNAYGGSGFGPDDPTTARDVLDEIVEDLVESATINTSPIELYTGEPAAWWADAPSEITGDAVTRRIGALLPMLGQDEPVVADVLGSVLAGVGATMVRVYDPTADAIRWRPVWYGPLVGGDVAMTIRAGDLVSASPASVSGGGPPVIGAVLMMWATRIGMQYDGDGNGVSSGVGTPAYVQRDREPAQVTVSDAGTVAIVGPDPRSIRVKYLHPFDPTPGATLGYSAVADVALGLVAARAPEVDLQVGLSVAMRCRLGTFVTLDIAGLPAATGQVRGWAYDVGSGRGTLTVSLMPAR